MSFGVGAGDIVLVTTLAWRLYKSCKEASEDFRRMSRELSSLHAVLGETSDYLEEYGEELPDSRKYRLNMLMDGCYHSLQELDALHTRYESLNTQSQRTWDRMRYGLKDLSEVRQRLISNTTMLTGFNTALLNSTTSRIEKKLTKFIVEVQAGMREGSIMSASKVASTQAATLESPDVWDELRRELEDIGISALVVEERHDFIVSWLKNAMDGGLLELNAHVVDIDDLGIRSRSVTPSDDGMSTRSLTPTNDMDFDSLAHSDLNTVGHRTAAMNAATQAFDAELRNENLGSEAAMNGSASSSQTTLRPKPVRRRTFGLVEKLFQKQTAIVQAASDGDLDRVKRLIGMGMDVNVVDRWGWSALSMCGYGGHMEIARLLLDHGAKIDNVDVDGDTPISLAAQRGHANVLIMLEEEQAIRKLKESETSP
ncbi:hypothetical protein B0H16DRAFT_1321530 [Mycena metata]|uniref:Fungal N-terminal domain-containing protein n=1 Tax=Mycena metata TaxID=1033252 RepID=A0AAD7IL37_9AGAR|nr:hypothetical protein B0H16DRAFT_1321530 [Mycena metata]